MNTDKNPIAASVEEAPLIINFEDMTPEMLGELCNGCEEGETADE